MLHIMMPSHRERLPESCLVRMQVVNTNNTNIETGVDVTL